MPEIGPTLREARMRARIDITEVEEATKIRAKYLRALENEEWALLPGPTYVKSFLREYAGYLGLDARLLVEEYKLRYERPSEHELTPISPPLGGERRRPGGGGARISPRWLLAGLAVLGLIVVLGVIGSIGGGSGGSGHAGGSSAAARTTARGGSAAGTGSHSSQTATAAASSLASVRVIPTGTVYVCLVDGTGKVLLRGATLSPGDPAPVYRARELRLTLGNNAVKLRVNGHTVRVPASSQAIAYRVTPGGVRPLPVGQAPTCT